MKFALPILALIAGLAVCESAQAHGGRQVIVQRNVVQRQVIGQRNVRQRQVVVQQVVAHPVVAVQAFHAPQFVAPVYSQQFVAPAYSAPVLQFNAGHSCGQFFQSFRAY